MKRLRSLRKTEVIRDLVSQTHLVAGNLIMPYFVVEGNNRKETIPSMPDVNRLSINNLLKDVDELKGLGVPAILLFGVMRKRKKKNEEQSSISEVDARAWAKSGIVQKAIKAIKKEFPKVTLIADLCLCGYTSHGHCGVLRQQALSRKLRGTKKILEPGRWNLEQDLIIDNDATLALYQRIGLSYADAGVDYVAPSGMMDGQVKAIRDALDKNGFYNTGIFSYSAKYASHFYSPFRQALESAPQFGDRRSYQMDYRNSDEALEEVKTDIEEGADIVMVKPALSYLDIIRRVKDSFSIPLAAYNVSGEYAMIKALCARDREMERKLAIEVLTAIKRAGADMIITYYAKKCAQWLK